ncbi:MAG: hypothetical protein KGJ23_12580 [Euryarchaeota archaeon]|nr:hypothetical protein [Euryarchaeota archaeon]MDE1837434.1 hypothetical protein [Euryarchaeota archaeon]MDE1882164.1 hypothetical protein [Euryarchaeota archaeon]MDE2045600.1 hypothetical protein [Thermoplasmata archaeon]
MTSNISAISTTTNRAVAGIPLPSYADRMAYDPNYAEVWANTLQTPSLQVISDVSNQVVANVSVGCAACPFTVDQRTGNVYQSEYGTMAIVSPAVDAVVDTFPVPAQSPGPIEYDPVNHNIYTTNTTTVSIVNTTAHQAVVNLTVSSWRYPINGLGIDPVSGDIFVLHQSWDNVTVISGTSNRVVANLPVGTYAGKPAFNATSGDAFIPNSGSKNVTIISDSLLSVMATVSVGSAPGAAIYNPWDGDIYLSDVTSYSVSILSGATGRVLQNLSTNPSCAGVPNCGNPGALVADPTTGDVYASVSGRWVDVMSGAPNNLPAMTGVSISPSSSSLPAGGTTTFTATPSCSGGVCPPGTTFAWTMNRALGTFNASTGSVVQFTAGATAGITYLFVNVTLNGVTTQSVAVPVTISSTSPPSISSFAASPSPIDVGWTSYLNVSASGGTGALSYAYSGLPAGCSSLNVSSLTCTPTVSGSFTVRVYVNDTAAHSATTTASLTVNPSSGGLTISGFSATPSVVSLGSMTTFTVSATGGTGALSFTYAGLPSGCTTSNTASLACTPTVRGSFTVRAYVNDTAARSATATTPLIVNPSSGGPVISGFSAVPSALTLGASTTFTISASGGSGALSYAYAGLPPGCGTANSATLTCTPSSTGSFSARSYANDTAARSATAITSLTVNPSSTVVLSSVAIIPVGANLSIGGSQAFSVTPSCTGGPCPSGVAYTWTLSSSLGTLSSQAGSSTTFTAGGSPGTETLTVTASLNGVSKTASAAIVIIAPAAPPPTFLGLPPTEGYLVLIVAIAVMVGISVAVVLARRRSRQHSSSLVDEEGVAPRSR